MLSENSQPKYHIIFYDDDGHEETFVGTWEQIEKLEPAWRWSEYYLQLLIPGHCTLYWNIDKQAWIQEM